MTKEKPITIALSGNPNSGKSTLFNAVTGARQHIANYPGVTVEKKSGKVVHKGREIMVVDLPGTYSLTAYSLEEIVTRDFLINERPDLVVDILDASNLERNLYLAVQFKEMGIPLIIALNMIDMAESRGIAVDYETLSLLFGAPVVPMVARSKKGITELLDKVIDVASEGQEWMPKLISYGIDIDQGIEKIEDLIIQEGIYDKKYPAKWLALKCLEGDEEVWKYIERSHETSQNVRSVCSKISRHIMRTLEEEPEGIIADHRYGYITGITKKSVGRMIESRLNFSDRIDRVLTNRLIGPIIMMAILYIIYEFTFRAGDAPVAWLESLFDWLKDILSLVLPEGYLHSLIASGIIDGVGGVLSFVPLIMFMFFAIAIMEDSGYMARVAYMLDRVMRWFGLHGNSVIALIVSGGISGGCAVPGVMATRTLRGPKERTATLLVVPFMNCGAKLPVYAMIIAAFFAKHEARMMFIFTLLSWSFALFAAKIIRSTVLRGPKTPFVMELPPYRAPTLKGTLIHAWERTWQYIKKAGTVILGVSVVLWAMMTFPGPDQSETAFYQGKREGINASFLSLPEAGKVLGDEQELMELNTLVDEYGLAVKSGIKDVEDLKGRPFFPVVRSIFDIRDGIDRVAGTGYSRFASSYINYRKRLAILEGEEKAAALRGTIAGRIGRSLEVLSRGIGLDYRTNIALIGGIAAKEVIVSTLGTAYSLGETGLGESRSLPERLRHDPNWNPLVAFTMVLFTMLYVPCFITVISIWRESSWMWAGFSMAFNLIVAYLIAFIVYQAGSLLGLGL